jgi:hypothetical protein
MELNIDGAAAMPIVVAVWVVGGIIKHAIPRLPNNWIPLITWVLSAAAYITVTKDTSGTGLITGVLVAAMATGIHSGLKNTLEPALPGGGEGRR